ncbi:MAG: MT-A70 family methyltransferase [Eubacteriales bacterium]|nr:MT-A70 family methyltransferase [Eubacteriales bacterium]
MDIVIDDEFKSLIPPLTADEYNQLEKSVISEGCRDALIVWNGTLIDGHNRYTICAKNGISFTTADKVFENREKVKEWIILNQFGRRNLSAYDRSVLALKLKELFAGKAKENLRAAGENTKPFQNSEKAFIKESVNTTKTLANIAGVSHDTIAKVQKIEEKATSEVKEKIRNGKLSINKAYINVKREEVKEQAKIIEPPKGKYRIIYADPPWQYGNTMETGNAEFHYPTMPLKDICELPIKELAEDNAVLFLWVTSPMLEESFEVIKAWGFKYKTSFIWDKVGHGQGYYNSVRHELLLVCTRGSCLPDNYKMYDSVFTIEKSRKHSEKPKEFRQMIDDIYTHGNKIELFSRKRIDGWTVWGNEA